MQCHNNGQRNNRGLGVVGGNVWLVSWQNTCLRRLDDEFKFSQRIAMTWNKLSLKHRPGKVSLIGRLIFNLKKSCERQMESESSSGGLLSVRNRNNCNWQSICWVEWSETESMNRRWVPSVRRTQNRLKNIRTDRQTVNYEMAHSDRNLIEFDFDFFNWPSSEHRLISGPPPSFCRHSIQTTTHCI